MLLRRAAHRSGDHGTIGCGEEPHFHHGDDRGRAEIEIRRQGEPTLGGVGYQ